MKLQAKSLFASAMIVCALLAAGPAVAQDDAPPAPATDRPAPEWRFTIMPYVWLSGIGGDLTPFTGAPTVEIDNNFFDQLETLDSAVFVSFGAERGPLVILGDFSRVRSSEEGTLSNGLPAEGRLKQTTLSLAAGKRVYATPQALIDIFVGGRAYWLEVDVSIAGGALSASPRRSFVDPIVGARAIVPFSPRWSMMAYGDIGGFGAGNDFAAVASLLFNYNVSRTVTLSGGYRSLWIDHDDKGTVADLRVGGPILGASFRF